MAFQFHKHYTRDEARALLPAIRKWLNQLSRLRKRLEEYEGRFTEPLANGAESWRRRGESLG
jgi:hypothetical protein